MMPMLILWYTQFSIFLYCIIRSIHFASRITSDTTKSGIRKTIISFPFMNCYGNVSLTISFISYINVSCYDTYHLILIDV